MKKPYVRPEVYFENFELSTNIATGCEYKSNHTKNQCGWYVEGIGNVFLSDVTTCSYKQPDSETNQYGICYHVPVDTSNLFTS